MLPQAVDSLSSYLDAPRPASSVSAVQPPQDDAGGDAITRLAERAQESLQSTSAPLEALLDPNRRQALTTSEMLWLQAAVSDYSVTLLTFSHLAQSAGSTIQSLTQRS